MSKRRHKWSTSSRIEKGPAGEEVGVYCCLWDDCQAELGMFRGYPDRERFRASAHDPWVTKRPPCGETQGA